MRKRKQRSDRNSTGRYRVALVIESSNAYARGLLRGIVRYTREHGKWSLFLVEQSRSELVADWLADWEGDGIIARIENQHTADMVKATGLPAVDLSAGRFLPSLPWVETDDTKIAKLAFSHLEERGFKSFAYCGDERFMWSHARAREFARWGKESLPVHQFPASEQQGNVAEQSARLGEWVAALPKPIGIFACYDIRGQQLLDACRRRGIDVPEEVAVLGVDNDELLCELSDPPLSSIMPNAGHAGYTAASLLSDMMTGCKRNPVEIRIAPIGVIGRQSTNILAVSDRLVAEALRFIRDHACDPISVSDLVNIVPVSRRVLEKRFEQSVGHTPHAEIVTSRIKRVKELLVNTDMSLQEIADRSGFRNPEYLSVMFKQAVGETPGRFRRNASPK